MNYQLANSREASISIMNSWTCFCDSALLVWAWCLLWYSPYKDCIVNTQSWSVDEKGDWVYFKSIQRTGGDRHRIKYPKGGTIVPLIGGLDEMLLTEYSSNEWVWRTNLTIAICIPQYGTNTASLWTWCWAISRCGTSSKIQSHPIPKSRGIGTISCCMLPSWWSWNW